MAAISDPPKFFGIDTAGCPDIRVPAYKKEGTILKLPVEDLCRNIPEIHKRGFQLLGRPQPYPSSIVYIKCKESALFCDGPTGVIWLEKHFSNPKTHETVEKVYLLVQSTLQNPYRSFMVSVGTLPPDMKNVALSLVPGDWQEIEEARRALLKSDTFQKNAFKLAPLFERTLVAVPDNETLLLSLAQLYKNGSSTVQKDFQKAARYYWRLLKLYPDSSQIVSAFGQLYFLGGDGIVLNVPDAFLSLFLESPLYITEAIIPENPQNRWILSHLEKLIDHGALDILTTPTQAVSRWREILKTDPQNKAALICLGILLLRSANGVPRDIPLGIKLLEEAYRLAPDDKELFTRLIKSYLHSEPQFSTNAEIASKLWKKIKALAQHQSYLIYYWIGCDRKKSEKLFRQVVQANPNALVARKILGIILTDNTLGPSKTDAEGVKLLEEVIEKQPNCIDAHFALGVFFQSGGATIPEDCQKAIINFQEALKYDPKNLKILAQLADLYFNGSKNVPKNWERTEYYCKQIMRISGRVPFTLKLLATLYWFGKYGIQQDRKTARALLREVLAADPEDSFSLTNLAIFCLYEPNNENENIEKAISLLNIAIQIYPQPKSISNWLSVAQNKKADLEMSWLSFSTTTFQLPQIEASSQCSSLHMRDLQLNGGKEEKSTTSSSHDNQQIVTCTTIRVEKVPIPLDHRIVIDNIVSKSESSSSHDGQQIVTCTTRQLEKMPIQQDYRIVIDDIVLQGESSSHDDQQIVTCTTSPSEKMPIPLDHRIVNDSIVSKSESSSPNDQQLVICTTSQLEKMPVLLDHRIVNDNIVSKSESSSPNDQQLATCTISQPEKRLIQQDEKNY